MILTGSLALRSFLLSHEFGLFRHYKTVKRAAIFELRAAIR